MSGDQGKNKRSVSLLPGRSLTSEPFPKLISTIEVHCEGGHDELCLVRKGGGPGRGTALLGSAPTRLADTMPPAAAGSDRQYDYLIKLLLIGDSGAKRAGHAMPHRT